MGAGPDRRQRSLNEFGERNFWRERRKVREARSKPFFATDHGDAVA